MMKDYASMFALAIWKKMVFFIVKHKPLVLVNVVVLDDHVPEEIAYTSVTSKHTEKNNINLLFCAFVRNLTNSPLIQHVVAWTSFSVRVLFCLSRTRMYHIIQISWRIMRQVTKDNRCSSLTDGPWCAIASINAAPISSRLVPYWPLRNSAFFLG